MTGLDWGNAGTYAKAIIAAFVNGATVLMTGLLDNKGLTAAEIIAAIVALLVGFGAVLSIPFTPKWFAVQGKAVINGLIAALGVVSTALTDGAGGLIGPISSAEAIMVVLAFLSGCGLVAAAPNAPATTVR